MPSGKHSISSAPQRFDSLLEALRTIILNFRAVLKFLVSFRGPWAERLLVKLAEEETEVALPVLCEYLEIGSRYVHKDEGHRSEASNLLTAYSDFIHMKEEFDRMFSGPSGEPPRCTSPAYTRGYYQILKKQLASLHEDFCFRASTGEVLYSRRKKSEEEEATTIARVMKKMQHVIQVFTESCEVDLLMAKGPPISKHRFRATAPAGRPTHITKIAM